MRHYCTLFDEKYLLQGRALHASLMEHEKEFTLHILAMNLTTRKMLSNLHLPNTKVYDIKVLLEDTFQHHELLNEFKAQYNYTEFCWSLASCFCGYLLDNEEIAGITYCDSDIYFFHSTKSIYSDIGDASIGIHSHKQPNPSPNVGHYNVGIIYFRNDLYGRMCLNWWILMVLTKGGDQYKDYATCGDQKFLDLFPALYGLHLAVFDFNTGHAAPWNVKHQEITNDKVSGPWTTWRGLHQPLVFFHFSHFTYDLSKNTFKESYKGEWGNVFKQDSVEQLYKQYFKKIKELA